MSISSGTISANCLACSMPFSVRFHFLQDILTLSPVFRIINFDNMKTTLIDIEIMISARKNRCLCIPNLCIRIHFFNQSKKSHLQLTFLPKKCHMRKHFDLVPTFSKNYHIIPVRSIFILTKMYSCIFIKSALHYFCQFADM